MPAPPRVGQLDLSVALSLVSTQPMVDVEVPDMVDTLRSDAIAESPFASSTHGSADVKGRDEAAADSVTFIASDVDRAAAIAGVNPKPAYPRQLLERGVEAKFSVYFVVDTAGRIDTTTIQVPPSVDSRFVQAVREVLVRWRFVPAEVRGRRVRQLMEQTFKFQIISGQFTQAQSPIARPSREADAAV
jgi:TonB family protein